ncbi:MAG: carboxypeptidase regulatory-like domain-containing protein [Cyclobacteriaceae bacterium]
MPHLRTLVSLLSLCLLLACQEDTIDVITFAQIEGQITTEDGSALTGAQLSTIPPTSITLTDSSGAFWMESLPAGEYTLTAEKNGYQDKSLKLVLDPQQVATLAITLMPSAKKHGQLSGILRDAITQSPVTGASLTTKPATTVLLTDANGAFQMDSLAIGTYTLYLEKVGYQSDSVAVAITESKPIDIQLMLTPQVGNATSVPATPFPAQDAKEQPTELTLTWQLANPQPDAAIRYDVVLYRADDPTGQTIATSLADTSFSVSGLEYETTYFWQVTAQDAQGQRTSSALWNFRTEAFPETVFLYTQRVEGDYEIFSANTERDRIIRLTHQVGYDAFPQFSPNRQWVAYTSQTSEGPQLFVMDKRGKQNQQISQLPVAGYHNFGSGFCWSPDGGQLLYSHYDQLYRINRDGTSLTPIATAPEGRHFKAVDWSGVTHKIVAQVVGSDINQSELYIMNEDGSDPELILADTAGRTESPSFSIDGKEILYTHDVSGFEEAAGRQLNTQVFRLLLETKEAMLISTDKPEGTNDLQPRFSPNGAYIIFESTSNQPGTEKSIWVMESDGAQRQLLVDQAESPDWG